MKHPISPDTSGLYEKIWNFVREQLSVRYPFFRRLLFQVLKAFDHILRQRRPSA